MKIKKHHKGLFWSGKYKVVKNGKVLYISKNYNACARYIAKHEAKKTH